MVALPLCLFAAGVNLSNLGGSAGRPRISRSAGPTRPVPSSGPSITLVWSLSAPAAYNFNVDSFYLLRHLKNAQIELYRVSGGNSVKLANVLAETILLNTAYTL